MALQRLAAIRVNAMSNSVSWLAKIALVTPRLAWPPTLLCVPLATAGCASNPPAEYLLVAPIEARAVAGAPPVRDGRATFRSAFCSILRAEKETASEGSDCDRWMWRLNDEPAADPSLSSAALDPARVEVVLVTGAFSECMGGQSRPLAAGADRLQAQGARVRAVVVGGRSGSDHNARQIAESLTSSPVDAARTVIMVGYSKGGLDTLRFLVDYPAVAASVDAVVGVATPAFGSPLADLAAPAYQALVANLPLSKCAAGDRGVINDLRPAVATQWLTENALPKGMRLYSLPAFAAKDRVARALVPTWKHLGGTEVRNDGQVVTADAIIPGSTLLGFANADHWGIALTTETVHPVLLARTDARPFPIEQLLIAIATFVVEDLARSEQPLLLEATRSSGGSDQ